MKIANSNIINIAGHNGYGTGAHSKWLDEGAETIVFRDLVDFYLNTKYNIVSIIDDDEDRLRTVIKEVKTLGKDENTMLISYHFNAASALASGAEVLIRTNYTKKEKQYATDLVNIISDTLNLKKRSGSICKGVKTEKESHCKKLGILSSTGNTSNMLVEICFLTNELDVHKYKLHKNELAEKIADYIYKNI